MTQVSCFLVFTPQFRSNYDNLPTLAPPSSTYQQLTATKTNAAMKRRWYSFYSQKHYIGYLYTHHNRENPRSYSRDPLSLIVSKMQALQSPRRPCPRISSTDLCLFHPCWSTKSRPPCPLILTQFIIR